MSLKSHMLSPQHSTVGKTWSLYEIEPKAKRLGTRGHALGGITGSCLLIFFFFWPHCEQLSLPRAIAMSAATGLSYSNILSYTDSPVSQNEQQLFPSLPIICQAPGTKWYLWRSMLYRGEKALSTCPQLLGFRCGAINYLAMEILSLGTLANIY